MPTRNYIQTDIRRLKGAGQDDIRHKYLAEGSISVLVAIPLFTSAHTAYNVRFPSPRQCVRAHRENAS
jgi:hypothetical protein